MHSLMEGDEGGRRASQEYRTSHPSYIDLQIDSADCHKTYFIVGIAQSQERSTQDQKILRFNP